MRTLPGGAEVTDQGVHFRIWAPKCKKVEVIIENENCHSLHAESNGYFSALIEQINPNSLYGFKLDGNAKQFPDPYSRFQPEGPHGPSQIINPTEFCWNDSSWKGIEDKTKVLLYELHIGTFTQEGTWLSAIEKLPHLADLGINVIEMMPIADFCGAFNWGYDGVNFFAPTHNYGTPNDLRTFINSAHALGIGVILDVVYNHFGPEGNYLGEYSEYYWKDSETEWGKGINFDGMHCEPVREFFIANAGYWIEEYHFDGLRLDACHAIVDFSKTHLLKEVVREVNKKAKGKSTYIIAENEQQLIQLALTEEQGGFGLNAVFCEDFHHSAHVRLVGHNEAYFSDYLGKAQEFVSSIKYGFLYQGQWYSWQKKNRGSPTLDLSPSSLINFLENHDQVANAGGGPRLRDFSNPGCYRAMTTLLLLAPQTPLLFQGQEFGSTVPFYYFSDMGKDLASKIFKGRIEFLSQFERIADPRTVEKIPLPQEESTFLDSKVNWKEKNKFPFIYSLFKDLIHLRKNDPVFSLLGNIRIEGAVLNENAFLFRYFGAHEERLLIFNFGLDLQLEPCPEPLIAPPKNTHWEILWTSEEVKYDGCGTIKISQQGSWKISGNSALILYAKNRTKD